MNNLLANFKKKKDLLGIVLTFMLTGFIASGADLNAYEVVAASQAKQEKQIKTLLSSEFISPSEEALLKTELTNYKEKEGHTGRYFLKKQLAQNETKLKEVHNHLVKLEAKEAKTEYRTLAAEITSLKEKSAEKFILAKDKNEVQTLENELNNLVETKKVEPLRTLAKKVEETKQELKINQDHLLDLVKELKAINVTAATLEKKAYLSAEDKTSLKDIQKANHQYFEDADDLAEITTLQTKAEKVIAQLTKKQTDSEKDFSKNKTSAEKLLKTTENFLSTANLTTEEKTQLKTAQDTLTQHLSQKNYQPGDLGADIEALQKQYDVSVKSSNQRNEEAKKQAAEKAAAEQAAAEKAAAEKAAEQATANQNTGNATPTPIPSGSWYQAPSGWRFLKVESGKTYRQVKIPSNFRLITEAEASRYSPGRGNGFAKQ